MLRWRDRLLYLNLDLFPLILNELAVCVLFASGRVGVEDETHGTRLSIGRRYTGCVSVILVHGQTAGVLLTGSALIPVTGCARLLKLFVDVNFDSDKVGRLKLAAREAVDFAANQRHRLEVSVEIEQVEHCLRELDAAAVILGAEYRGIGDVEALDVPPSQPGDQLIYGDSDAPGSLLQGNERLVAIGGHVIADVVKVVPVCFFGESFHGEFAADILRETNDKVESDGFQDESLEPDEQFGLLLKHLPASTR
jgi:hypothetical protein